MLVDFCLPVKNEEKILERNFKYLLDFLESHDLNYFWRIIIIINNSQDKSYFIAKNLAQNNQKIKVRHLELGGKGRALKTYFKESQADILVFMDIDLAVDLNDLPTLLNPILNKNKDLVIGSRLLSLSKTERSWLRTLISRFYNYLSRLILKHKFSDLQCGFKAFKKNLFNDLESLFKDNNWFFDTELVVLANYRKYRIQEIPVNWQEARYDQRKSKVKVFYDAWSFFKNLLYFKRRLNKLEICDKSHKRKNK